MNKGTYGKKGRHLKKRQYHLRKPSALIVAMVLIMGALVGTTLAYLVTNSGTIVNRFNPSHVTCEVNETFDGSTKTDVSITNTSDIAAYIRATYVVTWKNESGAIAPTQPAAGTDYNISFNTEKWFMGADGYYYYSEEVAAGAATGVLITSCTPVDGAAPEGYYLNVEILASAVQSVPASVVKSTWNVVEVANGADHGNLVQAGG